MKARFTFQSLILVALAPLVVALAGLWALHVYRSTNRIILNGFDRKLLAIAGGSAALTDGDAHASFQRRREISTLAPNPSGGFAAIDIALDEVVSLNPATGGARRLAAVPEAGVRSLTRLGANPGRLVGLTLDGTAVSEFDGQGTVARTLTLSGRLDGLFADGDRLVGWVGMELLGVDTVTGALTPLGLAFPESFRSVTTDTSGRWLGLTMDSASVHVLTRGGVSERKLALHTIAKPPAAGAEAAPSEPVREPPPVVQAISFLEGRLYAACGGLATVDLQTGEVVPGDLPRGYFDIDDPFFRQYRAAFTAIEKQSGLSFLYTQVYIGDKGIYYVLDGTIGDGYSRPGSTDVLPATSQEAAEVVQLVGRPWVSPIQNWQAWGLLKSCFTPIRNSSGKVVAMAGADVDIGVIRGKTRWALAAAILIGIVSLIAAGIVSLRVARVLTRPLQKLKESALWLAAGNYSTRITVGGSREVVALASTLDQLRDRLQQEHERSHAWLAELRTQRERTTLIHTLDELVTRTGANSDASGATGVCTAGDATVWWFGPSRGDGVSESCMRARLTILARELVAAGTAPSAIPSLLTASVPTLEGAACWDRSRQLLHFHFRTPVSIRADGNVRRCEGTGRLPLITLSALRWSAALPSQTGTQPAAAQP